MLYLLSPAKSLDYDTPTPRGVAALATDPLFVERSAELIALMRQRSANEVAAMMDLSDALAALNVDRYKAWSPQFTPAWRIRDANSIALHLPFGTSLRRFPAVRRGSRFPFSRRPSVDPDNRS